MNPVLKGAFSTRDTSAKVRSEHSCTRAPQTDRTYAARGTRLYPRGAREKTFPGAVPREKSQDRPATRRQILSSNVRCSRRLCAEHLPAKPPASSCWQQSFRCSPVHDRSEE